MHRLARYTPTVVLLACLSLVMAGCQAPVRLDLDSLERLDGFRQGDTVTLQALDGGTVEFTSDTALRIELKGAPAIQDRFLAIDFDGQRFVGDTGLARYQLRADEIREIGLGSDAIDGVEAVAAPIALVLVAAVITIVVAIAYFILTYDSGGGEGVRCDATLPDDGNHHE